MPDWLIFMFNDPVHTHGAVRLVAGAASGFIVTFLTGRLSVSVAIYLLMNIASFAYFALGMRSLETILQFMVLGSGFGGFAFGVGWLIGILICLLLWTVRRKRGQPYSPATSKSGNRSPPANEQ